MTTHNFSLTIASVNGSGTQTANNILAKGIFRHQSHVGAKNLFPSNISGLPTWFTIRSHVKGYLGREEKADIFICRNQDTLAQDLQSTKDSGFFFYDAQFHTQWSTTLPTSPKNIHLIPIPYNELSQDLADSIRLKKLLSNMLYVGLTAQLLKLDKDILKSTIADVFSDNEKIFESNWNAFLKGWAYADQIQLPQPFPFQIAKNTRKEPTHYLMDGNSAAALGAVVAGCTFLSWYPITPASSLAESFQRYATQIRPEKNNQAIVQAEDELSAISMVVGAGWAGARAMTSTSGPGLSLMAEAAGLSYFAEIPAVIWDVQRAGPSTGLPTRTMQGDLESAFHLSHGDKEHIVLLPSTPEECYTFAQLAFDLAEKYQTLVIVLSDLDLGMNFRASREFILPTQKFQRGKVLSAENLNQVTEFARYRDVDGDGICPRTLPGTLHEKAAYFARGTGHTETATYSENNVNYETLLRRLQKKMRTAAQDLPAAELSIQSKNLALLSYGSTVEIVPEVLDQLAENKITASHIRVKALPFSDELEQNLSQFQQIVVLEQNRDHQMKNLLSAKFPHLAPRLKSVTHFDGLPPTAISIRQKVQEIL